MSGPNYAPESKGATSASPRRGAASFNLAIKVEYHDPLFHNERNAYSPRAGANGHSGLTVRGDMNCGGRSKYGMNIAV